jgi:hypothetical protein
VNPADPDRFAAARAVADAVLYEGYVLYPYRASSRKNQLRWQFGVLVPQSVGSNDASERCSMRTECLVAARPEAVLSVRIRFLRVQRRSVEALGDARGPRAAEDSKFVPVTDLRVGDAMYVEWDEAIDQVVEVPALALCAAGDDSSHEEAFVLAGGTDTELIRAEDGSVAGRILRTHEPVEGRVRVETTPVDGDLPLVKVGVTVENDTRWVGLGARRDEVLRHSLIAVHTMLAVDGGTFVSLLDPPDDARQAAVGCHSDGAFPVLIGADDVVLSSPIILYDHPEVAPESPGDLYDATEIDEILALRVLTLTDEEKSEARGTDWRSAAIIDRCDDMSPQAWERLHGGMRPWSADTSAAPVPDQVFDEAPLTVPWWDPEADAAIDPWTDTVTIAGVRVTKGSVVRLRPSRRSDAQDLFLQGMRATVAGVFTDVDGNCQVAVTIDDDPATEELAWQGRYLFFYPDEVEPVGGRDRAR